MTDPGTIKRIDKLEAFGRLIIEEATQLRKSLSPVKGRASRKGLSADQKAVVLGKRFASMTKPKRNG
jgi:hypothetical protein